MRKELRKSQLNNWQTYLLKRDECEMLASNVFQINPKDKTKRLLIDTDNVNNTLLYNGSIAWFVDEVLGLLALPYCNVGALDINGYPTVIDVTGQGNYHRRLHKGEFVIMFDNSKKISILPYVRQYSERLSEATRVIDVNLRSAEDSKNMENNHRKIKNNARFII